MIPFSYFQGRLNSRVMKERSLPSLPLTGAKPSPPKPYAKEESPPDTFPPIGSSVTLDKPRIHQTLRVTPTMEAGISDHVWSLDEIVGLLP
jgi:hypothetical protein